MVRVTIAEVSLRSNSEPIYGLNRAEPIAIMNRGGPTLTLRILPVTRLLGDVVEEIYDGDRSRRLSINGTLVDVIRVSCGVSLTETWTVVEGRILNGAVSNPIETVSNLIPTGEYSLAVEGDVLVARRVEDERINASSFACHGFSMSMDFTINNFTGIGFNGFYGDVPHRPRKPRLESQMLLFREAPDPIAELEALKGEVNGLVEEIERMRRGEELLKEVLGEGRYKDFIRVGFVAIESKIYPKRIYIVREEGKVEVVEGGKTIETLCLVPTTTVGKQDVLALKKLLLESDERMFLKTANHFPETPAPSRSSDELTRIRDSIGRWFYTRLPNGNTNEVEEVSTAVFYTS